MRWEIQGYYKNREESNSSGHSLSVKYLWDFQGNGLCRKGTAHPKNLIWEGL